MCFPWKWAENTSFIDIIDNAFVKGNDNDDGK